jgi:hypothetical protein
MDNCKNMFYNEYTVSHPNYMSKFISVISPVEHCSKYQVNGKSQVKREQTTIHKVWNT